MAQLQWNIIFRIRVEPVSKQRCRWKRLLLSEPRKTISNENVFNKTIWHFYGNVFQLVLSNNDVIRQITFHALKMISEWKRNLPLKWKEIDFFILHGFGIQAIKTKPMRTMSLSESYFIKNPDSECLLAFYKCLCIWNIIQWNAERKRCSGYLVCVFIHYICVIWGERPAQY